MSEGITQRVKRLIAGTANAVVDAMENAAPELVMEQALRDVAGALDEVRAELGRVLVQRHLATQRLAKENERHEALHAQVELALSQSREDLAEAAISQQLDIEAQLPVLEQSVREADGAEKELQGYLHALSAKRRELASELEALRRARAPGDVRPPEASAATFDRIRATHLGSSAQAAAPSTQHAARLAELEELARKHQIQERLAAAKAKT